MAELVSVVVLNYDESKISSAVRLRLVPDMHSSGLFENVLGGEATLDFRPLQQGSLPELKIDGSAAHYRGDA